ncbi:MAG: M23 family metallopeptidase [Firmicutes bacterium]|nr:M23 family metallopeptidase [Bacillota bacterium]
MGRSYGSYRKKRRNGGKDWGRVLKRQVAAAILIVLFVIAMKSMGLAITDKAVSVMSTYLTKDHTVSQLIDNSKDAVMTAASWPVSAVASLRSDSGDLHFNPPADGDAAVMTSAVTGGVNGITYGDARGLEVYAVGGGTVSAVEDMGNGKSTVRITHGNQAVSVYRGCDQVYVEDLERVKKGEIIASLDPSGEGEELNSLTFELWVDGRQVNPADHMDL